MIIDEIRGIVFGVFISTNRYYTGGGSSRKLSAQDITGSFEHLNCET